MPSWHFPNSEQSISRNAPSKANRESGGLAISICLAAWVAVLHCFLPQATALSQSSPRLELSDQRLQASLFASDPDIVTPIGLAIDNQDRVFVLESHTHLRPDDYPGPTTDRIKVFEDADQDGAPESPEVFCEGLKQALNLAFAPDGSLYVICARQVWRLEDHDQDLRCDKKSLILDLKTTERYAHNSLLSLTFHRDGRLFIGRGNTGSRHYRACGTDGNYVEGYGDGGNILVCNADGSEVREFATGFWNPFDLKFDRSGRLWAVDNDPDARGPNRLVLVVEGADYGYKSIYGGSGNHPFQGWSGDLPGTLPFIAGTGEAPSGLLDLKTSSLPAEYASSLLVTVWNEHTLERFEIDSVGGGLRARKSVFAKGTQDFRPVAIACNSRGEIFVTDWVQVAYPNHGRGRIWKICYEGDGATCAAQGYFSEYSGKPSEELTSHTGFVDEERLQRRLRSSNPFLKYTARLQLAKPEFSNLRTALLREDDPQIRLQATLATRIAEPEQWSVLKQSLNDSEPRVRQAALLWASESRQAELSEAIDVVLEIEPVDATVFNAWRAAKETLTDDFIAAVNQRSYEKANAIPREIEPLTMLHLAGNRKLPDRVRCLAIAAIDDQTAKDNTELLVSFMSELNDPVLLAAMRRLVALPSMQRDPRMSDILRSMSTTEALGIAVRTEAIFSFSKMATVDWPTVARLVEDPNEDIAVEAARFLRRQSSSAIARQIIEKALRRYRPGWETDKDHHRHGLHAPVHELLTYATFGNDPAKNDYLATRPDFTPINSNSVDAQDSPDNRLQQWHALLDSGGHAGRGERVFRDARIGCSQCHSLGGGNVLLGPDLSRVAQSKSSKQIVDSIINPSRDFPPQYQAWLILTTDGRIHRGLQLDHKAGGAIEMILENGSKRRFKAKEIESYRASVQSLMPSGLAEEMTVSEFQDLLAFLKTLR